MTEKPLLSTKTIVMLGIVAFFFVHHGVAPFVEFWVKPLARLYENIIYPSIIFVKREIRNMLNFFLVMGFPFTQVKWAITLILYFMLSLEKTLTL